MTILVSWIFSSFFIFILILIVYCLATCMLLANRSNELRGICLSVHL